MLPYAPVKCGIPDAVGADSISARGPMRGIGPYNLIINCPCPPLHKGTFLFLFFPKKVQKSFLSLQQF